MGNYPASRQFAYIDPQGKFQRLKTPVKNSERMKAIISAIPHKAVYESVYGWTGWTGGQITKEISRTAVVDGVFLDFDDAEDPGKALMDAAEVVQYIGHSTCNFSGAKGANVMIHCHTVDLIPALKGHVIRQFVNELYDRLPELSTLDFSVVGDTSRVRRIIDSVHPKTKLHAIGLTMNELGLLSIDEVKSMAANRRGLVQVPTPLQWVTDELYRIEGELLQNRLSKLYEKERIGGKGYRFISAILKSPDADKREIYETIKTIEDEWMRIKAKQQVDLRGQVMRGCPVGKSKEETWLLKVVEIFHTVQRAANIRPHRSKVSTSSAENTARCHLAILADELGWDRRDIHWIFHKADDYSYKITDRMIDSLI